jgi:hypothetical protein
MAKEKRYMVVRVNQTVGELFVDIAYAKDKKTLRNYYKDWDRDTPEVQYRTVLIKKTKEKN